MAIIQDALKTEQLMLKVYNAVDRNKELDINDEDAIKKLCSAIFPEDGSEVSQHDLAMFNSIVAKVATSVSEADVQQLLNYFAEYENVPFNTQLVKYRKESPKHVKFKWSAVGSSVSLKKVQRGEDQYIQLGQVQTGVTYNPLCNAATQVQDFRDLVNDFAQARVQLVYEHIVKLIEAGATAGGIIPASQCVDKSNVTIADFDKVANTLARRTGSRPIFIADRALITALANKKATVAATVGVPEALKSQLYTYEVTNLGTADAVPMKNDFTTELGEDTHFPISVGYMLGSAGTKKPFKVALAGGLTTETEKDAEYGRIKTLVRQKLGIDFLYAGNIGRIEDDTVTSL